MQKIPSLTKTAQYRISDLLDVFLGELKKVKTLSSTHQINDFVLFSQNTGTPFYLILKPGAKFIKFSGPLKKLIDSGIIKIAFPG
jgi:hypothetical protein